MTLYLQHGHAKSTRITDAYSDGSATGVVFSPRNERIDKLNSYIAELRLVGTFELMLDPQFHISTVSPPKDRYLAEDYGYYQAGRTPRDFTGANKIQRYAKETLDFQHVRVQCRFTDGLFPAACHGWHPLASRPGAIKSIS